MHQPSDSASNAEAMPVSAGRLEVVDPSVDGWHHSSRPAGTRIAPEFHSNWTASGGIRVIAYAHVLGTDTSDNLATFIPLSSLPKG